MTIRIEVNQAEYASYVSAGGPTVIKNTDAISGVQIFTDTIPNLPNQTFRRNSFNFSGKQREIITCIIRPHQNSITVAQHTGWQLGTPTFEEFDVQKTNFIQGIPVSVLHDGRGWLAIMYPAENNHPYRRMSLPNLQNIP